MINHKTTQFLNVLLMLLITKIEIYQVLMLIKRRDLRLNEF